MAKIIIFGQRDYAEQAHWYFTHDSPHEVVAFAVTADQRQAEVCCGRPLVDFEQVESLYPPSDFQFFVPMSGRKMNRLREHFYLAAKAKGYALASYISSHAICCGNEIGDNAFILERVNLQPFAQVGSNVTIWSNVHVGHHSVIGDHVSIISGSIISGRCHIGHHSYLAAGSIINDTLSLAEGTLVSLGSVVKHPTPPWSVVAGNPAQTRRVRSDRLEFL
jgi:sugar O-acyltransferase (sialic acid O-acetyltransferase NeuD family)